MNDAFFCPAFRSRRFGHRQLTAGVIVKIGLFTWIVPALFGFLGVGLIALLAPMADFDSPMAIIGIATGLLLFAPIYGVMLVPLGLLIGAWAMRFGIAGWASAVVFAVLLPLVFGAFFQWLDPTTQAFGAGIMMAPVMLVHAMAMWIATRYWCPEALLNPAPEIPVP